MYLKFLGFYGSFVPPALLLFSVLSCICAAGAASLPSYGCLSDEIMKMSGPLPSAVLVDPPNTRKGAPHAFTAELSSTWEPLRITVSDKDLYDSGKYCPAGSTPYGKNPTMRNDMKGELVKCFSSYVLTPETTNTLTKEILPRAIKLHTDRLRVQRIKGNWKVPDFGADNACKHFQVPESHRSTGLTGTDMIIYVAGAPIKSVLYESSVSWAVPCAKLNGRPVAGALNFAPDKIVLSRHTVRIAAHELGHALGFTVSEMKAKNMIQENFKVRDKTTASVVKSDKTKEEAKKHFKCEDVKGVELQQGKNDQQQSHWARRIAKDDLMAPIVASEDAFLGLYTAITLAAFADLGYYKPIFGLAEPMTWGKDAGCKLLNDKCVKNGNSENAAMFCTTLDFSQHKCSSDRIGVGMCSFLKSVFPSIPEQFQYFADAKQGGSANQLTDYCPVIVRRSGQFCTNTETGFSATIPGSVKGMSSWCVDGTSLVVKEKGQKDEPVEGVCVDVQCVDGKVKIKYIGNDAFHDCPEGKSITVASSETLTGTIVCPKPSEVCTVAWDGSSSFGGPPKDEALSEPTVEVHREHKESKTEINTQKTSKDASGHKGHSDSGNGPTPLQSNLLLLFLAVAFCASNLLI